MGDRTGIAWTDATWNPVRGCSRVSEGCRNCYAERMAARFCGPGEPYEGLATRRTGVNFSSRWTGDVRLVPEHLADPLRWSKPRRVFVNSMSDLFHERLTNEQIAAVFGVMAAAPRHAFQILTKRAERMLDWFRWIAEQREIDGSAWTTCLRETVSWLPDYHERITEDGIARDGVPEREPWPLPNVWLGVSVENQAAADERIPPLLETPAAVRFLSVEPLIGAVDLRRRVGTRTTCKECGEDVKVDEDGCCVTCGLDALWHGVDWVIAGCESGPGARPAQVEWLRSLRDQCAAAGVPFFLKQAVATNIAQMLGRDDRGDPIVAERPVLMAGPGSRRKAGGVIELPYLDGVQHAAFPTFPTITTGDDHSHG